MKYRAGTTERGTMRMDKSKNKLSWTWSVRLTIRALKTYYVVNRVHVIVYIAIMAWRLSYRMSASVYRHV